MFNKFYKYIGEIRGLILIIYITLILTISVFNKHYTNMSLVFLSFFLFLFLSILICPKILKVVKMISIKNDNESINYKKWFIIISLIFFSVFLISYIIHYPGYIYGDTFDQYQQALTNEYDDWHPVIHTLFSIKLPLFFTKNNSIGAITIFHFIIFDLIISYTITTILKYTNKKIAILCFLFIILNPNVRIASFTVMKDVTFAMGAMLTLTYVMNIYFSKGKWLEKKKNVLIFIIAFVLTTLFRHNAILFTAPLMIAVLCLIDRKKGIKIAIIIAIIIVIIKGPIYNAMSVEKPGLRKSETLGLPMSIIATVYDNDKGSLPDEIIEFYRKLAPANILGKYENGDFNIVKGDKDYNAFIVEQYGYAKVSRFALTAFKASPKYSLLGFTKTTYPVYTITEDYISTLNDVIDDYFSEYYGISANRLEIIDQIISEKVNNIFPLFKYIGFMNLLVIIGILVQRNYEKVFIALTMLIYNFGTMMLLYGCCDSIRYFFYSFMIMPIILVVLFREEEHI